MQVYSQLSTFIFMLSLSWLVIGLTIVGMLSIKISTSRLLTYQKISIILGIIVGYIIIEILLFQSLEIYTWIIQR